MRVLLVRPRRLNAMTVFGAVDCEPLELEYLSAACRDMGAEPVVYDGILEYRPFSRVVREVRPDWVALTGYLTQEREMAEYVRLAKTAAPGCRVVVGGGHAQLLLLLRDGHGPISSCGGSPRRPSRPCCPGPTRRGYPACAGERERGGARRPISPATLTSCPCPTGAAGRRGRSGSAIWTIRGCPP